jgi:hypothetical protein
MKDWQEFLLLYWGLVGASFVLARVVNRRG